MVGTNSFDFLGRSVATSLGMPGLPRVIVPHPLGGLRPEEVTRKADQAFADILSSLKK